VVCEARKFEHMKKHATLGAAHCLFLNPFNLEIICVRCKAELLDWAMLPAPETTVDPLLFRLQFRPSLTNFQSELLEPLSQAHRRSLRGTVLLLEEANSHVIAGALYAAFHLPVLRKIAKATSKMPVPNRTADEFLRLLRAFWQGEEQVLPLGVLAKAVYRAEPLLCTYKKKDPYSVFRLLLKALDEQFSQHGIPRGIFGMKALIAGSCQVCNLVT
jgi:hypothetical protein